MFNNSRQLEMAEYICLAIAIAGSVVAAVSGKIIYVAVPLSALVLLNFINRRRFEVLTKQTINAGLARIHRQLSGELQSLSASVRPLSSGSESIDLKDLPQVDFSEEMQAYLASLVTVNLKQIYEDIAEIKDQSASLQDSVRSVVQYLNSSSLSARVDNLDQAIASLSQGMGDVSNQIEISLQNQLNELKQQIRAIQLNREVSTPPEEQSKKAGNGQKGTAQESEIVPNSPTLPPLTSGSAFWETSRDIRPSTSVATPQAAIPEPAAQNWRCVKTLTGHSDWVASLAITEDGEKIASGSFDSQIKIWNLQTGELIRLLSAKEGVVYAIALNSKGEILASGGSDLSVKVWELATGAVMETFRSHSGSIRSIAISPDGNTLASGSFDQTIKVVSLDNGKEISTLTGHKGAVSAIAFSPDGQIIASGCGDGKIKFWDWNTGQLLHTLRGDLSAIGAIAFHPNGLFLASASTDRTIKLWHLETLEKINTFNGNAAAFTSVIFSPDGESLIGSSADGTIKIWHFSSRKLLCTLNGNSDSSIVSAAISANGQIIISGKVDGTIDIWQRL